MVKKIYKNSFVTNSGKKFKILNKAHKNDKALIPKYCNTCGNRVSRIGILSNNSPCIKCTNFSEWVIKIVV